MYRLLFVLTLHAAGLPGWLAVYPGATAQTETAPGIVLSTYTATAKPEAVIAHYRRLWGTAGLPFAPNFNGMGTSIRAVLAECDLMVQVRDQGEGSHVRVTCAARNQVPGAIATSDVIVSSGPVNGRRARPRLVPLPPQDPHTVAVLAQADAAHRERVAKLGKFDNPVYPQAPRDPPGIPLAWPTWLVHMHGASRALEVQEARDQGGKRILKSQFRTTLPMTEIHQFYEDLMNSNGFRVGESKLAVGTALSGARQNHYGMVKGTYQPVGIGRGGLRTTARFSRSKLNEPILVVLEVELIRIYSNR